MMVLRFVLKRSAPRCMRHQMLVRTSALFIRSVGERIGVGTYPNVPRTKECRCIAQRIAIQFCCMALTRCMIGSPFATATVAPANRDIHLQLPVVPIDEVLDMVPASWSGARRAPPHPPGVHIVSTPVSTIRQSPFCRRHRRRRCNNAPSVIPVFFHLLLAHWAHFPGHYFKPTRRTGSCAFAAFATCIPSGIFGGMVTASRGPPRAATQELAALTWLWSLAADSTRHFASSPDFTVPGIASTKNTVYFGVDECSLPG